MGISLLHVPPELKSRWRVFQTSQEGTFTKTTGLQLLFKLKIGKIRCFH